MALVEYEGRTYTIAPGETVLDGLLRNGVQAAHACKVGSCGSCMLRAGTGTIPARAQSGFKESWKLQGCCSPCVCVPETDIALTRVGNNVQLGASITSLELLSPDVMRARLACDSPIAFHAGQYVTILREESLARSYSIASLPDESEIELHIRRIAGGRIAASFITPAAVGDRVSVLGPGVSAFMFLEARSSRSCWSAPERGWRRSTAYCAMRCGMGIGGPYICSTAHCIRAACTSWKNCGGWRRGIRTWNTHPLC